MSDVIELTPENVDLPSEYNKDLNRPEVRNAFRPQTVFELKEAFTLAREDQAIGVIILTVNFASSPGIIISVPFASSTSPVTSVVLK